MPMVWRGWKINQVFLNLEKAKATQGTVKKLEIDNKEIDNSVEINKELERFFENLFKRKLRKTKHVYSEFLRDISTTDLKPGGKKVVTKKLVSKKWFLRGKALVITNFWETMVRQKSFMKLFGKNWNNHSWIR